MITSLSDVLRNSIQYEEESHCMRTVPCGMCRFLTGILDDRTVNGIESGPGMLSVSKWVQSNGRVSGLRNSTETGTHVEETGSRIVCEG